MSQSEEIGCPFLFFLERISFISFQKIPRDQQNVCKENGKRTKNCRSKIIVCKGNSQGKDQGTSLSALRIVCPRSYYRMKQERVSFRIVRCTKWAHQSVETLRFLRLFCIEQKRICFLTKKWGALLIVNSSSYSFFRNMESEGATMLMITTMKK